MIFKFLKYLQPTHYFQVLTNAGNTVYPIIDELPNNIKETVHLDKNYSSNIAMNYDLSWRLINSGYIGNTKTYTNFEKLPLVDNYRFVRKYFAPVWSIYVLVLRVLTLKNPIKEFYAWFNTKEVKRFNYSKNPISYSNWSSFNSTLIASKTIVSVIIPTLNRYEVLRDVLKDLEKQDYKHFEVVIVDQSDSFNSDFYKNFKLNIKLIRQEEKALWLARNTAIQSSLGTLIALSEDDVRIESNWLSNHMKCLDFFNAKVSAGVFYPKGKQIPIERSYFSLATQFATGNAMLYKSVFKTVGLFDRQFEKQRMGDGEFGMRIYLQNNLSVSNPFASCIDVKAPTGGLREMGSWDAFRPSNFFAPRPIPSVIYYYRIYFGKYLTKLALIKQVPLSLFSYKLKKNRVALALSILVSIVILPFILIQVIRSWKLASIKINEGPKIPILKQ